MDLHKGAWHFLLQQGLPIFSFLSASHQHLDNSASIVTQKTHQSLNQLPLMSQQWWDALMAGVVFECLKDSSDPDAIVVLEERTYSSKDLFNIHLPSAVRLSMLALLRHRGPGWVWPYSTWPYAFMCSTPVPLERGWPSSHFAQLPAPALSLDFSLQLNVNLFSVWLWSTHKHSISYILHLQIFTCVSTKIWLIFYSRRV